MKISDSSTSRYKMKINLSCIEGNFNEDYTKKCKNGTWVRIININITNSSKPQEIPQNTSNVEYICSGCKLENKCYPIGYRINKKYCSSNLSWIEQLKEGEKCDNLFECESNACVAGQCISEGLIQKIINWFKKLFS